MKSIALWQLTRLSKFGGIAQFHDPHLHIFDLLNKKAVTGAQIALWYALQLLRPGV
jgi:hypothetical protein